MYKLMCRFHGWYFEQMCSSKEEAAQVFRLVMQRGDKLIEYKLTEC